MRRGWRKKERKRKKNEKEGNKGGTTKGMKMCFWNVAGLISKDKEV